MSSIRRAIAALALAWVMVAGATAAEPDSDQRIRITWAMGTVRDTSGKPVAGAKVYASAMYHCLRACYSAFAATTDQDGHYTVVGEIRHPGAVECMHVMMLLAYAPGLCPAMTSPPKRLEWAPEWDGAGRSRPQVSPQTVDFVLADQGGSLEVKVVQDGKPVPDATVDLSLQAASPWECVQWLYGGGPVEDATRRILMPRGKTGSNGVARFERLIPGVYGIKVGDPPAYEFDPSGVKIWHGNTPRFPPGAAAGVGVKRGVVTHHALAIYDSEVKIPLQVFSAKGTPLEDAKPHIRCPRIGDPDDPGRWGNATLDARGIGAETFQTSGLWRWKHVRGYTRNNGVWAPWDEASTVVAASRLLKVQKPLQVTERHVDAAKVNVRLLDAAGRPVRGFAWVDAPRISGYERKATDESGAAQLEVRPTWTHRVGGWSKGFDPMFTRFDPPPRDLGRYLLEAPLTDAAALKDQYAFPTEPFRPEPGMETTLVLKAQSVGYVHGRLKPHAGKTTRDYSVGVDNPGEFGLLSHCRYQAVSGNFVAGPFLPGQAALTVYEGKNGWSLGKRVGEQAVTIVGGRVTEMELRPVPAPGAKAGQSQEMLVDTAGREIPAAGNALLRGTIMMPDGKTPAMGATISYLSPEIGGEASKPVVAGIADAMGNIQPTGRIPPHGPHGRVAVASLPGTCGGVAVALIPGKTLQVTLPPPRDLQGKVTIGGSSPSRMPSGVRVLAAYQGKGDLNPLLSVETTADADGRFVLSGLTPGAYEVQAAVDDLWFSPTKAIAVGSQPLAELTLDVGVPGGATSVLLTSADSVPLQGEAITLELPAGPLANRFRPAEWRSDGAGRIHLPTLEAGTHRFHVKANDSTHEVVVPSLPTEGTKEMRIQVRLAK